VLAVLGKTEQRHEELHLLGAWPTTINDVDVRPALDRGQERRD
jgi:hypothetical protein